MQNVYFLAYDKNLKSAYHLENRIITHILQLERTLKL